MTPSRTIKVFFGSSVVELKNERQNLNSLTNEIINLLRQDNIFATFVKSEDMGINAENFKDHDQSEIDKELLKCDLSLFLFKSRAGKWTCHEYDVAHNLRKKEKRHTITVCFLNVLEEEKDKSLIDFQQRLAKEGTLWEDCRDLSEVKRIISYSVLHHLGISLPTTPEADVAEKRGEELFDKYRTTGVEQDELKQQLHCIIDILLAQIQFIMDTPMDSVVGKIVKVIELYYITGRWASKTDYDKEKYEQLLSDYGRFLYDYGQYFEAEEVSLHQICFAEKLYGIDHIKTAAAYNNIGEVYWKMGDFSKSMEYHKKALKIREIILGVNHADTASTYNDIGMVYHEQARYCSYLMHFPNEKDMMQYEQNKYNKAKVFLRKALIIREKVLGANHPETAVSYNNLGLLHRNQGNNRQALKYHKKALKIRESVLGKNHPDTTSSYNNIGVAYGELKKYPKALKYYFMALNIDKKILGIDHLETSYDYHNIGLTYYNKKEYKKALEYLAEALRIRIMNMGHEHPETQKTQKYIDLTKDAMKNKNNTKKKCDIIWRFKPH